MENERTKDAIRAFVDAVERMGARLTSAQLVNGPEDTPYLVVPKGYNIVPMEQLLERPRRIRDHVRLHDIEHFVAYVNAFKTEAGRMFGSHGGDPLVKAVLDYHEGAQRPTWGTHFVDLELVTTPEWEAWNWITDRRVRQEELAYFLEDNALDVIDPPTGELLEEVRTLKATKTCIFNKAIDLDNGNMKLHYTEETEAKAKETELRAHFKIKVAIYEGDTPSELAVLLRHRMLDGELIFQPTILQKKRMLIVRRREIMDRCAKACGLPLHVGAVATDSLTVEKPSLATIKDGRYGRVYEQEG
jgi:uncharacterized protein YfdQ (DUF2303 family)